MKGFLNVNSTTLQQHSHTICFNLYQLQLKITANLFEFFWVGSKELVGFTINWNTKEEVLLETLFNLPKYFLKIFAGNYDI